MSQNLRPQKSPIRSSARPALGNSKPMQQRVAGDTLGRYRLLRKVAQGGMAEVFIARSYGAHGFEKTVALKRILTRYGNDPHFVHMMVDEAKISVLLNHPNIAQIYELGEQNGDHFIVMEYVSGQALSSLMKYMAQSGAKLGVFESVFICMEMLEGLHAAHTQKDGDGNPVGIIHRDVSPQNLLLSWDGHVKIIDFGIARAKNRIEDTEQGTIKGKLRYLAPEVIDPDRFDEKDFDHRIDIWAAGVILHELVAWRKLFIGEDEFAVYDAICDGEIPDLTEQGCEPALMRIIQKALARDPKERYFDAQEMADALRAYLYRRDPTFTPRRIAEVLTRVFPDEKANAHALEKEDPALAEHEAEVHLTSTQLPSMLATEIARKGGSGSEKSGPAKSSSQKDKGAKARLEDALPAVDKDASTQIATSMTEGTVELERSQVPTLDERTEAPRSLSTVACEEDATLVQTPAGLAQSQTLKVSSVNTGRKKTKREALPLLLAASLGIFLTAGLLWVRSNKNSLPIHTSAPPANSALSRSSGVQTSLPFHEKEQRTNSTTSAKTFPLLIQTIPEGAHLTIRGDQQAKNKSPTVLMVKAGEIFDMQVELAGYQKERMQIVATANEPKILLTLIPKKVRLKILSNLGDEVKVNGKDYYTEMKVQPGTPLTLESSAKGRKSVERVLQAEPGKDLSVTLKTQPLSRSSRNKTSRNRQKNRATQETGTGVLVVTTTGKWGRVAINGRVLDDTTPIQEKLPAGTYEVVVSHPPEGKVKRFKIRIRSGRTLRKTVSF